MNTVKWLLVGAGDIARKRVASALVNAEGSELVGVCSAHAKNARSLAEEYGVPETFHTFEEALTKSSADAVYIATPVGHHVQQSMQALKANLHVLVEKPLGLNGKDCAQLVDAAEKTDRVSGCAYYRRLFPAYDLTRKMLRENVFGEVILARLTYYSWFAPTPEDPKHWRVEGAKSGGGPISDMGSHMLDVLIGLLGMPVSVQATRDSLVHGWDVEDCASMVMKLRNGAQVVACFSWASKTWRHEFEIVGTEAKIYWHPYDSGQITKTIGRDTEEIEIPPDENVHLPLVQDFVEAVQEGRQPVCPVSEAFRTNILMDAIYRSSRERREVRLEEVSE